MSLDKVNYSESLVSAADLSEKQYYLAKLDASGDAVLAAAGTDIIEGSIGEGGLASGDAVRIDEDGIIKVIAGGAITLNARITSDGNGKGIVTTTPGDYSIGRARAAAAAGEIFEVKVERWLIPA